MVVLQPDTYYGSTTKTCYRCRLDKPIDQFNTYKPTAKPGKVYLQGYCKQCNKEIKQETNKELLGHLSKLLREGSCKVCGEADWRCLVWHHRDPTTKRHKMRDACISWSPFNAELAKVDLVCANCHMKLHRGEDGDS